MEWKLTKHRLLLGAVALATAGQLGLGSDRASAQQASVPAQTVDVSGVNRPDLKGLFFDNRKFTNEIIDRASVFMQLPPPPRGLRNERTVLEEQMFEFLESNNASAGDIISGMKAANTIDGRAWGNQLFWAKRQNGELTPYGIKPMDQARIDWALANRIDPRTVANYRDCIFPALELMQAAPDLFFEGMSVQQRRGLVYEHTIPNPGALAMLNFTETGFTNNSDDPMFRYWADTFIGGSTAWNEINLSPEWFPSGHDDLTWLASRLQDETGLPYLDNVKTIAGSERGNPILNGSGGAVGPQFMPINLRLFMQWYDVANSRLGNKYPRPNPFVPFISNILSITYLAGEWDGRHGTVENRTGVIRKGYNAYHTDDAKIAAFRKWNPTDQARWALDAGYSYFSNFGRI